MFKRHRRMILAAVAAFGAGFPAAAQEYELFVVEALSQFGIPECYLSDVNNGDVAVGTMTYTTQDAAGNYHTTYHGFSWTATDGPVVDPSPSSYGAINDLGDILAGATIYFDDGHTGWMVPVPGDRSVGGSAINDAGVVVGTSTFRFYSGCRYERRAVYWTEAGGTVNLESFVPTADVGVDINNGNEMVGNRSHSGSCGDFKAFLYRLDTDEWVDLHTLLAGASPGITEAHAINELGQVAGEGWNGSFISAWVWDPAEGFTFLPALKNGDRDRVTAYDLNSAGVVVGSAATDGWADRRAFIWDAGGGMRDLNDLVALPPNFILDRAIAINEGGVIVGDGHWGPAWGPAVAFALIPAGPACDADFNDDGAVDFQDLLVVLSAYGIGGGGDVDCDGDTDFDDLVLLLTEYGT